MKNKNIFLIIAVCFMGLGAIVTIIIQRFIPWVATIIAPWGTGEITVAVAIIAVFVSICSPILDHFFAVARDKQQNAYAEEQRETCKSTVYSIDINVKILENNFVLFSASIKNVGDKRIQTCTANLYIDQGEKHQLVNDRDSSDVGVAYYEFPFILEHKEYIKGRPDCVLCKKCFREHVLDYPEEIVAKSLKDKKYMFRAHYKLKHLSEESIKYINPKEIFSEDVIVQFKNQGVYRVTLFVGAEDEADCSCATKQFYIKDSLSDIA